MKTYRWFLPLFSLFCAVGALATAPEPAQENQIPPKLVNPILRRKLVHRVMPIYPVEAKRAGIEGKVVLSALIGKDGRVRKLRYVSGPPLLVRPSIDAVRQWVYPPTLLNGKPVEVQTKITVTYTLGGIMAGSAPAPSFSTERPAPPPRGSSAERPIPTQPLGRGTVRVGPQVEAAKLIRQVMPVYPSAAKRAGIQGTVTLRALIDRDGRVERVLYVSGPTELVGSAMAAVRQWEYKPTLLNGKPVKVETQITVIYSLPRAGSSPAAF